VRSERERERERERAISWLLYSLIHVRSSAGQITASYIELACQAIRNVFVSPWQQLSVIRHRKWLSGQLHLFPTKISVLDQCTSPAASLGFDFNTLRTWSEQPIWFDIVSCRLMERRKLVEVCKFVRVCDRYGSNTMGCMTHDGGGEGAASLTLA
jgi:hypothetical protein